SPPAMTSTPSPTEPASSSAPSSPGYANRRHALGEQAREPRAAVVAAAGRWQQITLHRAAHGARNGTAALRHAAADGTDNAGAPAWLEAGQSASSRWARTVRKPGWRKELLAFKRLKRKRDTSADLRAKRLGRSCWHWLLISD